MRLLTPMMGLILLVLTSPASAVIKVLTCEPEWQALVTALGGEYVKAGSATTAFQDPHYVEARPSLIAKARQADLLVCTGAELEVGWLPLLLRQSGNAAIQENEPGYFLAAEQVERIEIPKNLDRSQGDIHASGNPHVHWGPYRLLTIAKALSQRLQLLDAKHAIQYQEQYQAFAVQWKKHISQWESQAAELQGTKVIVYHKNWSYLLRWLGVKVAGNLEPKPGIPPTSAHLAHLLELARSTQVDYILISNYQDDKGARWLSEKTGIPILNLPYTVGGNKKVDNLISLYNEVIAALTQ